jgi:hypothetical protein
MDNVADISEAVYYDDGEVYSSCIITQEDGAVWSFDIATDDGFEIRSGDVEYAYRERPSGGVSAAGWTYVYGSLSDGPGSFSVEKNELTEEQKSEGIVAVYRGGNNFKLYADGRLVWVKQKLDTEKKEWVDIPYTVAENAAHADGNWCYVDSDRVLWSVFSRQMEGDEIVKNKILDNIALPGEKISASAITPAPATATAKPTASTVLVNGKSVAFEAYNINDNNYFKLRDLAYVLSGTEKQFEVGWDGAANAIALTGGKAYTPIGGEMTGKGAGDKQASPTTSAITLDGKDVSFTAYNIDGNNYFKLRDIGAAFDFGVTWDGAKQTISIDTGKGYTPE